MRGELKQEGASGGGAGRAGRGGARPARPEWPERAGRVLGQFDLEGALRVVEEGREAEVIAASDSGRRWLQAL